MSVLFISDLHAHNWSRQSSTLPDGRNSRFADLMNVLDQVREIIEQREPQTLILGGDITHRRMFVQFSIYTPIGEWIRTIGRSHDIDILALVGNHDIEALGAHSLGPLAWAGVEVFDTPRWFMLRDFGHAYFVPYMPGDAVANAMRHVSSQTTNDSGYAFLHYALDGTVLTNEYAVPSALRLSDCDDFSHIVLGHVHAPSVEHAGRVTYGGAVMHFDYGDVGPRFAWWFEQGKIAEPIELHAPKFVSVTYPQVPAPPEHGGFLRVLGTPRGLTRDVQKGARDLGWLDVSVEEQALPHEAVEMLTQATFASDALLSAYVDRHYESLSEETRAAIVEFGSSCLRDSQK